MLWNNFLLTKLDNTMYKKQLLCIALCMGSLFAYSQNPEKAKALLDEVYDKVKSYDNISIDFTATLENDEAQLKQETHGHITLSGERYDLEYLGAQQRYDGEKVYTVIPENEEVTIENGNKDESAVSPSQMLTFYRTGHRYAWDKLQNIAGRKIQYVKLIPTASTTEITSILLGIDVHTKHIYTLIQTGNNGTKTTITVNTFKTNLPLSKTQFTFNEKKYQDKGYYIVRH